MATLANFSEKHGIQFPLLSDVGSVTMERLGLIDPDIVSHQATYGIAFAERHRGLPYPGTFVIDESGMVISKYFDESYRDRVSGSLLLSQVGGESMNRPYVAEAYDPTVTIRASVDESVYRPMQKSVVHVEVEMAEGLHTYVNPVPEGYTALSVQISDATGLVSFPPVYPEGKPFVISGLAETFMVVGGSAKVAVPFKISGTQYEIDGQKRSEPLTEDTVILNVTVTYQLCSDRECFPPAAKILSIPLTESPLVH